jgi:hypothetical protein
MGEADTAVVGVEFTFKDGGFFTSKSKEARNLQDFGSCEAGSRHGSRTFCQPAKVHKSEYIAESGDVLFLV